MPIPNDDFFRDLQAMRRDWMFSRKPVIGRGRPPHHAVLVELLEDLLPGQSAQAVILEGSPGSEVPTNVRIECYDSLLVTGQIDAETRLFTRPIAGLWQVDREEGTVTTARNAASHWHGHLNGFVTVSSAQTLSWTEDEVSGEDISHSSGVITIATAGVYCFQVNLVAGPSGSPFEQIYFETTLRKNSSAFNVLSFASEKDNSGPAGGCGYGWTVEAAADDTFDIQVSATIVNQDFWGSSDAASKRCTFSVHRVR